MGIMREIERLYTPLISRGLHKFKDGFNLADKDERMRKGGKGEMGETYTYILIIPVVFGWWRLGECVCWGERGGGGAGELGLGSKSWTASTQSPVDLSGAKFSWASRG